MRRSVILLSVLSYFAVGCGISKTVLTGKQVVDISDFAGDWYSESGSDPNDHNSLRLLLNTDEENPQTLYGRHWATVCSLKHIDYPDSNQEPYIFGYINNDTVHLRFTNSWGDEVEAKLFFGKSDYNRSGMIWELIRYEPELVSFFPKYDTLHKTFQPQIVVPDEVIPAKKVKKTRDEVRRIDGMALRADTLSFHPKDQNVHENVEFNFYDDKGRLRKYYLRDQIYDASYGGNSIDAYYNGKGRLVYIAISTGSNCEYTREEYWVHNGHIVDFIAVLSCDCCDDTDDLITEDEIIRRRPKIGDVLKKTIGYETDLTEFVR